MVLYQALAEVDELGRQLSGLAPVVELVGRMGSAVQHAFAEDINLFARRCFSGDCRMSA